MRKMEPNDILRVEQDIIATLKNIYDPEIPVNVYDLGLVYNIDYMPDGTAEIQMTLTAPNCPMADMLVEDVRTQVAKIPGVERVNVALVFDPPWDKDMMSDEASGTRFHVSGRGYFSGPHSAGAGCVPSGNSEHAQGAALAAPCACSLVFKRDRVYKGG